MKQYKSKSGIPYYGVRKVKWDRLWHALYQYKQPLGEKLHETWDRVTEKTALKIAKSL